MNLIVFVILGLDSMIVYLLYMGWKKIVLGQLKFETLTTITMQP